jgi:hypothetical protein
MESLSLQDRYFVALNDELFAKDTDGKIIFRTNVNDLDV